MNSVSMEAPSLAMKLVLVAFASMSVLTRASCVASRTASSYCILACSPMMTMKPPTMAATKAAVTLRPTLQNRRGRDAAALSTAMLLPFPCRLRAASTIKA